MEDEIEKLKKQLEFYQKKFSVAEHDLAIDGYLVYAALVRQQVAYLKDFKIKDNIDGKKTETVLYDRAIAMGESLPKMITSMNNLKMELKIEFDENEGKVQMGASTPQSMFKRD